MAINDVSNKTVLKAGALNFVGTFLLKGITYISVPIFTRIMDPVDYGYVSTYTTYIAFLVIIVGLSLNTATANARIDFDNRFDDYNSSIIKTSFVIFIIEWVICNLLFGVIGPLLSINRTHLNIVLVIAFSEYIVNSYYKINTVDFKFKENLKVSISNAIISLVLSVTLVTLLNQDITAKLVGQGAFVFFVAVILLIYLGFIKSKEYQYTDVLYALRFAIPNIFHQISQLIMSQSDRVIILNLCGAVEAAKYSVVYNFGLIIQMIWNAINEVWVPWLYRQLFSKKYELIIKLSKIYILIFTFGTCLLMLIAPDLMAILAPESYFDAKPIIAPIVLAVYFIFIYSFFVNIEIYNKKNKYMAIFTVIAAVVNICGNYLLIPIYGYQAAAYTTLASYILLAGLHFLLSTYILKINIYKASTFLPSIIMAIAVDILSFIFLENYIIRYCFVLCLIIVGIVFTMKKKNVITEFVESIKK